jgi:restriction system protein
VRPVEREDVQVLADKLRAVGAQKAILFATNGFQRGALEYARAHGIALVRVIEGKFTYEMRNMHSTGYRSEPPPWANIRPFVGHCMCMKDGKIHVSLVEPGRIDALKSYLETV